MTVRELLDLKGREVFSIEGHKTVEDAIRLMDGRKISAMLVTEHGRPVGIFTERDVLRCYLSKEGAPFKKVILKDIMTSDLIVAEPDEELCTVMTVMIEGGIRHLPVVEAGKIAGMLSIRDIVKTQVGNLRAELHHLKDYISGM